jgi:hypothetical protein
MESFLASLQFWHWLILAAVLGAIGRFCPACSSSGSGLPRD